VGHFAQSLIGRLGVTDSHGKSHSPAGWKKDWGGGELVRVRLERPRRSMTEKEMRDDGGSVEMKEEKKEYYYFYHYYYYVIIKEE
jgi:hypothetical protein